MLILPSLLASNPLKLHQDIENLLQLGINHFHIDMMDYHFTPNFGLSVACCSAILSTFPEVTLDVHLMMNPTPIAVIKDLLAIGVNEISIHKNTVSQKDWNELTTFNELKLRLALLPSEALQGSVPERILLLAVSPGFSGQEMQPEVLEKSYQATLMGSDVMFDGGVNLNTADKVLKSRPSSIVIGSGLIGQPAEQQKKLMNLLMDPLN